MIIGAASVGREPMPSRFVPALATTRRIVKINPLIFTLILPAYAGLGTYFLQSLLPMGKVSPLPYKRPAQVRWPTILYFSGHLRSSIAW